MGGSKRQRDLRERESKLRFKGGGRMLWQASIFRLFAIF